MNTPADDSKPGKLRRESDPALQRRLTRAADGFDEHGFVYRRSAEELLSRLELLAIRPRVIADIGAATGWASGQLARRYPDASVLAVERNQALLSRRRWRHGWSLRRPRVSPLRAALGALPLADSSVDLAFCNLALARFGEPDAVLAEISRVVRPGGAFVFATPGPDTLRELRRAWGEDASGHPVAAFTDMHDIGDALGRAGFTEPVLDVDVFRAEYRTTRDLWRDLSSAGARNSLATRSRALTGAGRFADMERRLTGGNRPFTITVEMVYGQGWGGSRRRDGDAIRIAPSAIGRRQR